MKHHARIASILLLIAVSQTVAQQRVALRNTYERMVCVVPMVGAGTPADPRRPLYAPLPGQTATHRDGIIAFSYQLSDDGQYALIEFVARDREAFKEIAADNRPDVKAFHKGKDKRGDIEKEFRKHKKDFDLDHFGVSVP